MNNNTMIYVVPSNLKIDELTQIIPPDFSYKRDGFIYLIDLWFQQHQWRKNDSRYQKDDYVPFHSQSLKAILYDYKKYLDYMIVNKIFEVNDSYQTGVKSKSYKLNSIYYTDLVEEVISNKKIIQKILHLKTLTYTEVDTKHKCILKWFDKLTINESAAITFIENYINSLSKPKSHPSTKRRLQLRKLSYIQSVKRIANKDYKFSIDQKSGRLYTPLTNLKKELRQFLRYNNKPLVGIDLSNSQPYLSTLLLNKSFFDKSKKDLITVNNLTEWVMNKTYIELEDVYRYITIDYKYEQNRRNTHIYSIGERSLPMCGKVSKIHNTTEEWEKFKYLVSKGTFYEYIGNYISTGPKNRLVENPKKLVITVLFSSPKDDRQYFKINAKVFEELFPCLYQVYTIIKQKDHSSLAILLQNIEAEIFLNMICPKIQAEDSDIPIFTIHDSICTTEEYVNKVRYIMNHNLIKAVGLSPKLKIEYW